MRRVLVVAIAVAALAFSAAPAPAQVSPERAREVAHEAASQLRSPVTPSHTLDMCPAAEAEALRDTVLMAASQGMTAGQIVEGVIARRGEQLRIVPRREGFGIWAWLLPPAVLLLGLGVVSARLRAMRAGAAAEPAPAALSADDREVLAAAMAEMDRSPGEEP